MVEGRTEILADDGSTRCTGRIGWMLRSRRDSDDAWKRNDTPAIADVTCGELVSSGELGIGLLRTDGSIPIMNLATRVGEALLVESIGERSADGSVGVGSLGPATSPFEVVLDGARTKTIEVDCNEMGCGDGSFTC